MRIIKRFADVLNEQVDELEMHVRRKLPDHRQAMIVAKIRIKEGRSALADLGDMLGDMLDIVSRPIRKDPS